MVEYCSACGCYTLYTKNVKTDDEDSDEYVCECAQCGFKRELLLCEAREVRRKGCVRHND